uniref:Uncharacterized protein n=1 Tax=Sinocyclocheilus grahami TaxID=75366 RepID=A0A672K929_SINGR
RRVCQICETVGILLEQDRKTLKTLYIQPTQTQLRNQLIQELHPAAVRRGDAHSVLVTACNSVVVHHLRSVGCDYTLAVFLPECGMSKDQVLSARELLQLTKISPHTPLYKSLVINRTFLQ